MRAVVQLLGAAPGAACGDAGAEIDRPQLMIARHGDVQGVAGEREVPGGAECARGEIARGTKLATRARDGAHAAGGQIDRADGVIPGVGDVEHVVAEREPLRIPERRVSAIDEALGAGADDVLDAHAESVRPEPAEEHPVMARVGDRDAVAVDGDLARKRKLARGRRWRLDGEVQRSLAQRAIGAC